MIIFKAVSSRGPVYRVRSSAVHIFNSPAFAGMEAVADVAMDRLNGQFDELKPDRFPQAALQTVKPLEAAGLRALNKAAEAARTARAAFDTASTPSDRLAATTRNVGPEVRNRFRNLTPAEQAGFINSASPVELAALLEHDGALSSLDPTLHELARERALVAFHIERAGLASSFPAVPSLNRIIAIGTDTDATNAAAEQQVTDLKQHIAAVEDDEAALQHLVRFIADVTETTPAETLERILAAN